MKLFIFYYNLVIILEIKIYIRECIYIYIYIVDRASRYKFLLITNLTHIFVCLFISSLYVFRASVLIIRRSNCINTSSGMISLCK